MGLRVVPQARGVCLRDRSYYVFVSFHGAKILLIAAGRVPRVCALSYLASLLISERFITRGEGWVK